MLTSTFYSNYMLDTSYYDPLFRCSRRICIKAGYPLRDVEYESAVNWAVYKAMRDWKEEGGRSPKSLACLYALRECYKLRRQLRQWKRGDELGPNRPSHKGSLPIPLSDFNVLQFVALHGIQMSAKLLGMRYERLKELVDEIELRVRQLLS